MKIRILQLLTAVWITAVLLYANPFVSPLHAGENEDFRFADRLLRDKMYVAAAEEFLRFAEMYPRSALRPEALMNAGESYMKASRASSALEVFETFLESFVGHEDACKARFYRGRILAALKRYREAADEMLLTAQSYAGCNLVPQALLEAGEALIAAGDSQGAARVLRTLVTEWKSSSLVPRARYSLAIALSNIGRDLEADDVLDSIVSEYPSSPVAAIATLRLGESALSRGELDAAGTYFQQVLERFKEKSLREKASIKIMEIYTAKGAKSDLVREAFDFLDAFPGSERRAAVYKQSIYAAKELGDLDRALSLIDSFRSETLVQDSTGEYSLLRAQILYGKGKPGDALGELKDFRHLYSGSPFFMDALLLEAELFHRSGRPLEAARFYHMALLEEPGVEQRLTMLSRLADLSVRELADTLGALRCWDAIVREDAGGEMAEQALRNASRAREHLGDWRAAAEGYTRIIREYPGGSFSGEAERRLEHMALTVHWGEDAVRHLARVAASGIPPGVRSLEVGVVLLDETGDALAALEYLEESRRLGLPDSLEAKALYYTGKAYAARYRAASARGEDAGKERGKALSMWREVARNHAGTAWGGRAHRGYLELKLEDWSVSERITKLDEYIQFYGAGREAGWALGMKMDMLYERAKDGEQWAADSALAVGEMILSSRAGVEHKREAAIKRAYLLRMRGDFEGAAGAFGGFVEMYGDDPRKPLVLYDLGEALLKLGEHRRARDAYERCLACTPQRLLAEKCSLRVGDTTYYQRLFEEAASLYGKFREAHPDGELADESAYREALAREQLGEYEEAGRLLGGLARKEGLAAGLRIKVLKRLGQRLLNGGDAGGAAELLRELVSLDGSAENLSLCGDAQLACGEYKEAVRSYSRVLKSDDADTCHALAGRAMARYRLLEFKAAGRDLALLSERCPSWEGIAGVLLVKGEVEVEDDRCDAAVRTLSGLRERYPGTKEATFALYHESVCVMKRGGYEAAIEKLEAVLREPAGTEIAGKVYFKLASAHFASGNPNLAASNYARAAEAAADRGLQLLARKNLAKVYQDLENWDKAAAAWQRITELFPETGDIVEIFFNLGFCYMQAGRNEMAYEVYNRIPAVASTEEQQGRSHYWSGTALKNLGRYAEAAREFLRVPYLKTGGMWGVTSKLEAASCYEAMGDIEQAEKIYVSVVASHGAGSDWGRMASEALARIRGGEKERSGTERERNPGERERRDGS